MFAILCFSVFLRGILSQSFTFPLGPNQPYPQYNNAFNSRFQYIPSRNEANLQMTPQQHFSLNPMTRIQVQPPLQQDFSSRVTSPLGPSEYQVDQKVPRGIELPSQPLTPSPSAISSQPTRIIPPFLKSASGADQDKFYEIVQHPTWSAIEKNRRIEEFMRTMSEERQSEYTSFRRDVSTPEMEARRRDVDRAVSSMSKEAVEQFQRVVRIMHDPNQSEPDKLRQIEQIYTRLPDAIRREFDVKLKGF